MIFHAVQGSPADLASLCDRVAQLYPDGDQYVPQLPVHATSRVNPMDIVAGQFAAINALWEAAEGRYTSILLIGHSFGSLLARAIVLCAVDDDFGPPGDGARDWRDRIDRVVLLAGMNRGWSAGHHLGPVKQLGWTLGTLLADLWAFAGGKPLLIMALRRGAPFLTELRVRWILAANRLAQRGQEMPLTVQLLGSIDDVVAPSDNLDLISGRNFVYLDVPYSGHKSVIDLACKTPVEGPYRTPSTVGSERGRVVDLALRETAERLAVLGAQPGDRPLGDVDTDVRDLVFVIHGIRDVGHWTQKIARAVVVRGQTAPQGLRIATETSSYGFFPMLPFLLPWTRRQKVEWFMDQYAEGLAAYPKAEMSFIGHSNGTYLLARALESYPFCRFKHVVFAGSVVSSRFDWERFRKAGQVQKVLNFVATADWVVAIFPKAIEMLRLQDLGSGGHDGFGGRTNEIAYIKGAHGAALTEANWMSIAEFVVTGEIPQVPEALYAEDQNVVLKWVGRFSPLIWLCGLAAIGGLGFGLWSWFSATPVLATLLLVAYLWLLWKILTRL